MLPGEVIYAKGDIQLNKGCDVISLRFISDHDRPITLGAFLDIAAAHPTLRIDRFHGRLDLPSGLGLRLEPGDVKFNNVIKNKKN
ncbi:urease subunit beta [Serratia odorifera]|uniref:urease subunit beta n=1 Tax=Serratia odorifera TaxID=618 RepID=UPI003D2A3789